MGKRGHDPEIAVEMAEIHSTHTHEIGEVIRLCQYALRKTPQNFEPVKILKRHTDNPKVVAILRDHYQRGQQYRALISLLDDVAPTDPATLFEIATIYFTHSNNHSAAFRYVMESLWLDFNNSDALSLAHKLKTQDNISALIDLYEAKGKTAPSKVK